MTGWKRRSSAGSPRIHLSYSPPVVAPMIRLSPRTSAGFNMLAASIAAPSAVPWPIRLCSSSTNRIRSGSVDSSRTSLRIRSSYCPRNAVPASRATWSRATMRASFSAGGTSAAAMRCASPSTMAVFPTPAFPISAGLFLLWRSRMSTARAISASRQRTGSRSPRRAWAVRSMPKRSSSALPPESNSPSNGSPIPSPRPQEPQIPVDDGIAEHEHHGRAHGEEYPERDVTLLAPKQERDVHQAAEHRRREHGQQHTLPANERGDHRRNPQHGHRRLDDRVLERDRVAAAAAPPAQQQPGHDRDVVPPGDGLPAARAGGGRVKQRPLFLVLVRQAQDADVQKAPEAQPEDGCPDEQDRISDHGSPRRAGCPPRPRRSAIPRPGPAGSPHAWRIRR